MKVQKYLYKIVNFIIRIMLVLIVLGLCLQSMFSTSFIGIITKEDGSIQDRTLNIADSPVKHLLVFVVCIAVLVLLRRFWQYIKKKDIFLTIAEKVTASGLLKILCILTGIAGCVWIMLTQLRPGSDPAKVYELAIQWRENNFSGFAEGGYLFRYPYQSGIVLFFYMLSFFLGIDNYIGLQLINVAALILVYYFLAKLAAFYWKEDKKIQTAVYLGLAAWIPLFFYVTYLYGILLGMACSLAAVYMAVKYLETRKYRYIVIGALCMGIATVFKMNCLIYMVAISCFLIYDIIVTPKMCNKIRSLLFILLMVLGIWGCNESVYRYVEHLSGYEMPEGEVMVSWVVMGLQDTPLGPGGYSGYIGDVFVKYDYDTEKITEASIADIKKIMTRLSENPLDEGLPFFARKNAFQWNDPTFIGMVLTKNRTSAITMSEAVQSVIEGKGSVRLSVILNYAQTLILSGVLCYLILQWKSRNLYELFGGVIFLGGYLFHFFWESSSSYTIPYFVIIIPYAVKGWLDLARRIDDCIKGELLYQRVGEKETDVNRKKLNFISLAAIVLWFVLLGSFSRTALFQNTIALDDGEEARNQFYQKNQIKEREIINGYFVISPYLAKELALAEQDDSIGTASILEKNEDGWQDKSTQRIAVVTKGGSTTFRFRDSEKVLAILPEEENRLVSYMDDGMNMFYDYALQAKDNWTLQQADESCYYIVMNGWALTYDTEENLVMIEAFTGEDTQKWLVR